MTFSIVARCAESDMYGVAVSSSSPAVAARCAFARARIGAAVSQNVTDPALGPAILNRMEQGLSAAQAVEEAARSTEHREHRQLAAVDRHGASHVYTGARALGTAHSCSADNVACAGNLLATPRIPDVMVAAFQSSNGHIADRLLEVLRAARDAGGEAGPVRSAGLMVVRELSWPIVDLRVDWTEACPIEKLAEAWTVYQPQVEDYVTRAVNPAAAPGYGVPGDEADV